MSALWQETSDGRWQPASELPLSARLVDFRHEGTRGTALLVPEGRAARVNGTEVVDGLRVLDHKDEITLDMQRFYFSAESAPEVILYRGEQRKRPPRCGVCRGPIQEGEQVVRCPGCERLFHQIEASDGQTGKTCWTYAEHCKFCGHPTSLCGQGAWHPDMEESGDGPW